MHFSLKNYIFGFGSGIVVMSLVFYCVYSVGYKNEGEPGQAQTEMNAAAGDDLFAATERPGIVGEGGESLKNGEALLAEGSPRDVLPPPENPPVLDEPPGSETPEEPSSNEPPQEALREEPAEEPPEEQPAEEPPVETREEQPAQPPGGSGTDTAVESGKEVVLVVFEKGMGASDYARIMAENGVVDDAAAFRRFIVDNGMSSRLDTGAYYLPVNGAYDEVLDIVSRAYKQP